MGGRHLPGIKSCGWLGLGLWAATAYGDQRFPPPEFETGHQLPLTTTPAARAWLLQYADVAVLAAALGLASWLIFKKRSRKGLVTLSIFSVLYFGFYRKGCVCAIGSAQNIALALGDPGYAVPLTVVGFFVLPLVFALFFGRAFCAGVCPHGALQDLVLVKPVTVPTWLEQGLSILPYIYLGAGALFAATGSAFIFCEYDPFVPIFRMSGRTFMVASGAGLLVLGLFVGRPYCRFLCPYGALLKLASMVAKWRIRVTPDFCTQCRLCEASCPFGAMRQPQPPPVETRALSLARRDLSWLLLLLPVLIVGGGWLGSRFSAPAAKVHPAVRLAETLLLSEGLPRKAGAPSPDDLALDRVRQSPGGVMQQAIAVRHSFATGGWIFGAWIGLVVGCKLISLSLHRSRTDYEPDRGDCFGCARCFEYCPNELARRGAATGVPLQVLKHPQPSVSAGYGAGSSPGSV
jgi:NosR/NirI family nitrous oxide reductase transcriptional regulator